MTVPVRPQRGLSDFEAALVATMTAGGRGSGTWARKRVRKFTMRVGGPQDWEQLGLERQLGLPAEERSVATWLLASGQVTTTADYLVQAPIFLGIQFARCYPAFHAAYVDTAERIGMEAEWRQRSWAGLAAVCVINGTLPADVTITDMVDARRAFLAATRDRRRARGHFLSMGIARAQLVLFHLGQVNETPGKLGHPPAPDGGWGGITPNIRLTLRRYLDRLALVRRPGTVLQEAGTLRQFARYLTRKAPEVQTLADLRRPHLEAYRTWLAVEPASGGAPARKPTGNR